MVSCLVQTVTPSKEDSGPGRDYSSIHMTYLHSTASSPSLHLSYRREHKNNMFNRYGWQDDAPFRTYLFQDKRRLPPDYVMRSHISYHIGIGLNDWGILEEKRVPFSSSSRRIERTVPDRRNECSPIPTQIRTTMWGKLYTVKCEESENSTFHFHLLPARFLSSFQLVYVYVEVPLIKAVVGVSSVGIVCDRNECSMRLNSHT